MKRGIMDPLPEDCNHGTIEHVPVELRYFFVVLLGLLWTVSLDFVEMLLHHPVMYTQM